MILIKFLFITAILYLGPVVGQQECVKKFMDLSLVKYRAQNIGTESMTGQFMASYTLRVLWEYQFNCSCVNITSLILGINIRRVTDSRRLFPSVQVFTPKGSQYNLVTGSERIIYYTTSNVSTNGMIEYPLDPPIKVTNGDVLAISQPFKKASVVRVYYINGINFSSSMEYHIGSKNIDTSNFLVSNELILVYPVTSGYCVNSTNSITAEFVKKKALEIQRSQPFYYLSQYIYPQIVFSCNGSVTKWIFGAYSMGSLSRPELQIWRQLGPNNYNKIGSSLINATKMIGSNLYEFIPEVPLQFQEGDMFGVYSNNMVNGDSLILYEQRESGPMNLRIGPRLVSPLSTILYLKLYQVSNDYPLVTVEISQSTDLEESSTTEYSGSPYPSQLVSKPSQSLSVSAKWLIGGIIGAITIISLASILVLACIIVFIKKRVNLHNNMDYSIIDTRKDDTQKDDTKQDDTLIMNDMTSVTPMQDNSAYGSTHDAAVNENPAYDSYSDGTYLYMSNNLYATVDEVKQDQDDDQYI